MVNQLDGLLLRHVGGVFAFKAGEVVCVSIRPFRIEILVGPLANQEGTLCPSLWMSGRRKIFLAVAVQEFARIVCRNATLVDPDWQIVVIDSLAYDLGISTYCASIKQNLLERFRAHTIRRENVCDIRVVRSPSAPDVHSARAADGDGAIMVVEQCSFV